MLAYRDEFAILKSKSQVKKKIKYVRILTSCLNQASKNSCKEWIKYFKF